MANRYPLIIDATDKKLKELPVGDNLRVDGDVIISGDATVQSLNANNLFGNLTGDVVGNLTGDVVGNLTGDVVGSLFADDNSLLVDAVNGIIPGENIVGTVIADIRGTNNQLLVDSVNNTISYSILSDTPFIPTDISELTDIQGLLGDDSTIEITGSFVSLSDTPDFYDDQAGKFIVVSPNEDGLQFGDISISQNDIESALGFLPYDGVQNSLGFLTEETDTLQSVAERGNSVNIPVEFETIAVNGVETDNLQIKNELTFSNDNATNEFFLSVEQGKVLNIDNKIQIDSNRILVTNTQFLGDENSTIGEENDRWNGVFTENLSTKTIKNPISRQIFVESTEDVNFIMSNNRKVKMSGVTAFQLPRITATQRNSLTPEIGDMIYNFDEGTVQAYVGTTGFTEEGDPIPGWINLYTPPQDN